MDSGSVHLACNILPPDQRNIRARAHKVRALAASLAVKTTKSLKEILDAAYWKSEFTSINFFKTFLASTRTTSVVSHQWL